MFFLHDLKKKAGMSKIIQDRFLTSMDYSIKLRIYGEGLLYTMGVRAFVTKTRKTKNETKLTAKGVGNTSQRYSSQNSD